MSTPELVQKLKETAALFRQSDPHRAEMLDEAAERMDNMYHIDQVFPKGGE